MIYFVTAREMGRVKIGFSDAPHGRFIKMRTDSPSPLIMERVREGSQADEKALHERFSDDRIHGEWFKLSSRILDYMEGLPLAASPASYAESRAGQILALSEAIGCSYSYASKMLGSHRPVTIPVALSVFFFNGMKLGPIAEATDEEIVVLDKFCGRFTPTRARETGSAGV